MDHPLSSRPSPHFPPQPPSDDALRHSDPSSSRTLNFRDAISYLDQVKVRFKDQNDVYNQFLEVMKLFKTQSIDTLGVIERLSTLFRGYPTLIQGFNTFLPPGFRIDCCLIRRLPPSSDIADLVTVYTPPGITNRTSLFPRDGRPALGLNELVPGSLPDGWIPAPSSEASESSSSHHAPCGLFSRADPSMPSMASVSVPTTTPATSPPPGHAPRQGRQPSSNQVPAASVDCASCRLAPRRATPPVEDVTAAHQLLPSASNGAVSRKQARSDVVKPSMPTFPKDSRGASPCVSIQEARASTPSRDGRPSSRSGFTASAPTHVLSPAQNNSSANLGKMPSRSAAALPSRSRSNPSHGSDLVNVAPHSRSLSELPKPPPPLGALPPHGQPSHTVSNKPVEFNYAINYVNKIKHRFIDQPEIYKTFLEILQTYQRDGMPIDSVYVKVTQLFSNAVDLLDEFKQFLPDLNHAGPAATCGSNVSKSTLVVAGRVHALSQKLPNGSPSFSSSTSKLPIQEKLPVPLVHPQPISHVSHTLSTMAGLTSEPSENYRSIPWHPHPPTANSTTSPVIHDLSSLGAPRAVPRSLSPNTMHPIISRASSVALDPQVVFEAASRTLAPPFTHHTLVKAKGIAPVGSASLIPTRSVSASGYNASKPPAVHAAASTASDSLFPPKHTPPKKSNHAHLEEEDSGPPRKKRAFSGLSNHSGTTANVDSEVPHEQSNIPQLGTSLVPLSETNYKPLVGKARRPKSKPSPAIATTSASDATLLSRTFEGRNAAEVTGPVDSARQSPARASLKTIGPAIQEPLTHRRTHSYASRGLMPPQSFRTSESMMPDPSLRNPSYVETHDAMGGRTLTNTRELLLFESIKAYLNDKDVWLEFLRVLELYNLSIIDFKTLMDRVSVFIGDDDELLEDFKGLVGYDVKNDGLVEDEVWEIKNRDVREREKVDASLIPREYGPSYKKLPRAEIDLACSGRDELCWSVLNDEYFGAAKFGTESGGPGHRKTNFEEVLAMTEGERAHFSYWLECISRTIGHLESLQVRIDSMDGHERARFQLGDTLGGVSPSIYHRTLYKVYEAKYNANILPYLRDHPAATVPVVLRRLKELEQSWKSAESQWNVIWREVEKKNYYKAQDHQVVAFKSDEKSLLKGVKLLKELQDLKENKKVLVLDVCVDSADLKAKFGAATLGTECKLDEPSPSRVTLDPHALRPYIPEDFPPRNHPLRPSHQVELGFQDLDVFFDVLRVVVMSLDRSTLSHPERRRIDETIRTLIPAVWNISAAELEKHIPILYDDESEQSDDGQSTQQAADSHHTNQRDLLDQKGVESLTRGLLKVQTAQGAPPSGSRAFESCMSSPPDSCHRDLGPDRGGPCTHKVHSPTDSTHSSRFLPDSQRLGFSELKKWMRVSILPSRHRLRLKPDSSLAGTPLTPAAEWRAGRWYNVFGTSTYHLLLRLLHMLYSRLLRLKTVGLELGRQSGPPWRRINSVALELGLSQAILGLDDHPQPSSQLYPYCLDQLSRYFDGEIDITQFEESIRVAFPKDGYLLSTVDKITNAILKQLAQLHQEPKNKELLMLLKRERDQASTAPATQVAYRHEAQMIVDDGDLLRAEWHPARRSMSIQIVSPSDPTFELSDARSTLLHYIDTYEYETPTELTPPEKVRTPYLRSHLSQESTSGVGEKSDDGERLKDRRVLINRTGLVAYIDPVTYALRFSPKGGRSDVLLVASGLPGDAEKGDVNEQNRKQKFETWLSKRTKELAEMADESQWAPVS